LYRKGNASYRSVEIQNEIISLCGEVLKNQIIQLVQNADAYSVIADETADVSGSEHLSIRLRYFHEGKNEVQKSFVGFVEIKTLDAKSIGNAIEDFLTKQISILTNPLDWDLMAAQQWLERRAVCRQSYARNTRKLYIFIVRRIN